MRTLKQTISFLGGLKPVLSKIGVMIRTKQGRTKKRIILDVKESTVAASTRRKYRVLLPRIIDWVNDALSMLETCGTPKDIEKLFNRLDENDLINFTSFDDDEEAVEFMILDFVDAFWQIPLHREERRFFVARIKGEYFVFRRTAQGSRNGPFSWACVAAHAQRLAQSLFVRPPDHQEVKKDSSGQSRLSLSLIHISEPTRPY